MSGIYAIDMDAGAARDAAIRGGTLVLLDVPAGTAIGLDQQMYLVGPRFRGVKMVPPGPHLVSYSFQSREGQFGLTTAFFIHIGSGEVVVRQADPAQELLLPPRDEDLSERVAAAVHRFEFDAGLAPYNLHRGASWRQLSCHITPAVLDRLAPVGGSFSAASERDPDAAGPRSTAERRLEEQLAAGRAAAAQASGAPTDHIGDASVAAQGSPSARARRSHHGTSVRASTEGASCGTGSEGPGSPGAMRVRGADATGRTRDGTGRCFYTRLPHLVKVAQMAPSERTAANLDRSAQLREVIDTQLGGDEAQLLGELQFSFLAFLQGHSLEGFAQWRAILMFLFGSVDAATGDGGVFYSRFLTTLHAQLTLGVGDQGASDDAAPADATAHAAAPDVTGAATARELLHDSFLAGAAKQWFEGMAEEQDAVTPDLADSMRAVRSVLQDILGWGPPGIRSLGAPSEDEYDSDGPVVVAGT